MRVENKRKGNGCTVDKTSLEHAAFFQYTYHLHEKTKRQLVRHLSWKAEDGSSLPWHPFHPETFLSGNHGKRKAPREDCRDGHSAVGSAVSARQNLCNGMRLPGKKHQRLQWMDWLIRTQILPWC